MESSGEKMIAACPLEADENSKKTVELHTHTMAVGKGDKKVSIPIASIRSVDIQQKIALFPAIIGGIVTPFSLIAAFSGVGHPLLMIIFSFGGIMALYYGLSGQEAFTVFSTEKEYHFFLYTPNPFLPSFIQFTNQFIRDPHLENAFYINIPQSKWVNAMEGEFLSVDFPKKIYMHKPDTEETDDMVWVRIKEPLSHPIKITFRMNEEFKIEPILESDLKKDWLVPLA